ncbi:MAG TPA: hypothetical protein GXX65_07280 [Methanosarcina sp.]|nr:hypothetical protein [Methanosarcina sp.]
MLNMNKYGRLLLSAYIMKKVKLARSSRGRGTLSKYFKLALGAYLLSKLKSGKPQKEGEMEPEEMIFNEPVEVEAGRGSSMKIGKIILGALAGATLIYAVKKRAVKKRGQKIKVE